jgi:hypothetical protein
LSGIFVGSLVSAYETRAASAGLHFLGTSPKVRKRNPRFKPLV